MFMIGDKVRVASGCWSGQVATVVACAGQDYRVELPDGSTMLIGCRGLLHCYEGVGE